MFNITKRFFRFLFSCNTNRYHTTLNPQLYQMQIICCIVAHYIQIVFNHINNVINNNTNTGTISTKWLLSLRYFDISQRHNVYMGSTHTTYTTLQYNSFIDEP
jgi:hypothetical protein